MAETTNAAEKIRDGSFTVRVLSRRVVLIIFKSSRVCKKISKLLPQLPVTLNNSEFDLRSIWQIVDLVG
jgi:hypothetical protein